MDYSKFANDIIRQDGRNIIEKVSRATIGLPNQLADFYDNFEPINVEIVLSDMSGVKLYPLNYLSTLQNEYNLGESSFVFATKNSDPIALLNDAVVTFAHGSNFVEHEKIALCFDDYVDKLMANMKF